MSTEVIGVSAGATWNRLLIEAQQGVCSSQEELCSRLHAKLMLVAQYSLRGLDRSVHEDLVQETMKVLWENLEQIEDNPQYYARKVLSNKIGEYLRARKFRSERLEHVGAHTDVSGSGTEIEDDVIARERLLCVCKAILQLSPFCRKFYNAWLLGQSRSEIWTKLRADEPFLKWSTFYSRVNRCQKKLEALAWVQAGGRDSET